MSNSYQQLNKYVQGLVEDNQINMIIDMLSMVWKKKNKEYFDSLSQKEVDCICYWVLWMNGKLQSVRLWLIFYVWLLFYVFLWIRYILLFLPNVSYAMIRLFIFKLYEYSINRDLFMI